MGKKEVENVKKQKKMCVWGAKGWKPGGEAAEGRRLDEEVVCVCFAMLGVPLGSASLMGEMD